MKVFYTSRVKKSVEKMPQEQQEIFYRLVKDIQLNGPVRFNWPHYGILTGTHTHHCHLSRDWVACWYETVKGIEVEVTYAGIRGKAPYAKH